MHLLKFVNHEFCICVHAQSYLTVCDPMDCSLPGFSVLEFSRQEYWIGLPFPPPGDLPWPGFRPVSPASPLLQADSSPLRPQGSLSPVYAQSSGLCSHGASRVCCFSRTHSSCSCSTLATSQTAARQASLSFTVSLSLLTCVH